MKILTSVFCMLLIAPIGFTQVTLTDSNLPIVVVTVPSGQVINDDTRVVCDMGVIDNPGGARNYVTDPYNDYNGKISIEMRGSTSQQYPKKNYGFETQDISGANNNVSLMGLPVENDWIFYGPYPDKTMIRNMLTYSLSRKMGHYASGYRACELIINDEYRGVYILLERIKRDNDRVDITKLLPSDLSGEALTGGYIVKVDKLTGQSDYNWTSNYNNKVLFQFHDPEYLELASAQASYMENFVGEFEDAIYGPDFEDVVLGYPNYIETQSFYDFFILQELGRTVDGYRSSSFMHKDRANGAWNGKMIAGPMWDFNLSYGNADYCDADITTGWQYNFDEICDFTTAIPFWWEKLLESESYRNGLKCRWNELRNGPLHTDSINYFIDSMANYLEEGRIRNFQKWPIIGVYVNWNGFVGQTYQEDLDFLKSYVAQRSLWMDANLPGGCNAGIAENEFIPEYTKAWPNPTNGELNMGFTLQSHGDVVLKLFDFSGRELTRYNFGNYKSGSFIESIRIDEFTSGSYFYTLTVNDQIVGTGKILKN